MHHWFCSVVKKHSVEVQFLCWFENFKPRQFSFSFVFDYHHEAETKKKEIKLVGNPQNKKKIQPQNMVMCSPFFVEQNSNLKYLSFPYTCMMYFKHDACFIVVHEAYTCSICSAL